MHYEATKNYDIWFYKSLINKLVKVSVLNCGHDFPLLANRLNANIRSYVHCCC